MERGAVGASESVPDFTNVAQLVGWNAELRPAETALVDLTAGRRVLTWAELDRRVSAVAAGLAARGLVASHRVAVCGPNSLEYVVAYFAALRAGFVVVPINPEAGLDEKVRMIADSGARLLFGSVDHELPEVRRVALTEQGLAELEVRPGDLVVSPQDREALAVLLYTAGTSGEPKGAMLTHRALLAHVHQIGRLQVVSSSDRVLALLPLFHVFGLNAVLGVSVSAGATLVIMDASAGDVFAAIRDEQITNLPLAPSALYRMLQSDELVSPLGSVRTVVSGAAPLPAALAAEFQRRTGLKVEQGYGLTEAGPGVATTFGVELLGAGHVGRPLPGVEVRIGDGRDETEPGEIWIRGDNLFSGYWPDGQGGPGRDGWFATGDVGYRTGEDLFLVDRARELILVSGFNVYPAEVEGVIAAVPGVDSVAVVGQPVIGGGERVVAFVVGAGVTIEQLRDHCAQRLAPFKRPSEIRLVDELPRGATGKVRKGALRQLLAVPGADD
ncbi:long-chain fatty acid--CoA ligase [Microlunatus panaciterrae]|nr:class I adenylate-forming enzyme family protein [Microlunatus panaciterrae]